KPGAGVLDAVETCPARDGCGKRSQIRWSKFWSAFRSRLLAHRNATLWDFCRRPCNPPLINSRGSIGKLPLRSRPLPPPPPPPVGEGDGDGFGPPPPIG